MQEKGAKAEKNMVWRSSQTSPDLLVLLDVYHSISRHAVPCNANVLFNAKKQKCYSIPGNQKARLIKRDRDPNHMHTIQSIVNNPAQ